MRRVTGGMLVQSRDLLGFEPEEMDFPTARGADDVEMADLRFAWLCAKHVRSAGAVLARDECTESVGSGRATADEAARLAMERAGEGADGATLAVDMPLRDPHTVEAAAAAGLAGIIQPGGSPRDGELAAAADRGGLAMALTGTTHIRH
jgi:phosphoribosylaminoimidazolecarboxamide formyltransferase/IMP cyclohydrolase